MIANTTNYSGTGGTKVSIESITPYPNYQHAYDIAVIVLAAPIEGVTPRAVGTSCSYTGFADETMVHLVGFGLTAADGTGNNTSLREAMAPVLDADCSGGNGCRAGASPSGEFVAGGDGADSCFGDSGGPVYLDTPRGPVAIASVSRGLDGSALPCGGGIYVRTDKVIAWIEETTGRTIAKDSCVAEAAAAPGEDPVDVPRGCSAGGGGTATSMMILLLLFARRHRRVR